MKKSLFMVIALVITLTGLLTLPSCNSSKLPKGFKGEWSGQLNRNDRIELKILDKDEFRLKVYQSNARYDMQYYGKVTKVSDDIVQLQAESVSNIYNSNKLPSDPVSRIGDSTATFFLKSDGAFSQTEYGLNDPMTYLSK